MRFPWNRAESELDTEIAYHLNQLTAEYQRQGYSREEAARMAAREFGGSGQIKEKCRDESRWAWLTALRQDLLFGIRTMRRTPVITVAAVLSLALGIGANTAIVSLTDIVLWRDLPLPHPQELTIVNWTGHGFPRELSDGASGSMRKDDNGYNVADFFSYPSFQSLRHALAGRAYLTAFTFPDQVSISYAGKPLVALERPVSGNFLTTLEVKPALGRLLSDADDQTAAPAIVVVAHRFWSSHLGADPAVIGKIINVNTHPYVIAGVLQRDFGGIYPGDSTDLYTALHHRAAQRGMSGADDSLANNRFWGFQMLARRAPGVTDAQLQPVMDTVFPTTWSRQPKKAADAPRVFLEPGSRGLGFLREQFRNPLLVLGGLVALLLVIACTNIANLLLARAVARRKEVAIRISLGCGRPRLMRQFLTESALLAVSGGVVSLLVAYLTANLLGRFLAARDNLPIAVSLDFRVLAIVAFTTSVALLLFGIYPAWRGSRVDSAESLKQGETLLRRKWNVGQPLLVVQMAMSIVLVLTAVIFTRNLLAIESSDPGFDRRNLVIFSVRPGTSGYDQSRLLPLYYNLEHRLGETPGVAAAGMASMRPMNIGGWWESVRLADAKEVSDASINGVTPTYLPLYSSHLVAGRNFTWADLNSQAKVTIVSEDLARKLGGPGVLGKMLEFTDGPPGKPLPQYEIVGIAPLIAPTSMKDRPYAVWLPLGKDAPEATLVLRTTLPPQTVLPAIRKTMESIDRNLPMVDVTTMEEQISKGLMRERMFATLCSGFGILAVILSLVGLYGVIAYSTSRRRGEIGIRLALGALPGDVVSMIFREGLRLAALGVLLGAPIVWLGAKYLEKELFQMKPLEMKSLLLALGIQLAAALIAVWIPATRAAALHPSEVLRQE